MLRNFKKLQLHTLNNKITALANFKFKVQLDTSLHFSSKKYNTNSLQKFKTKTNDNETNTIGINDKSLMNIKQFSSFELETKYRLNQAKRSLLFKLDNKNANKNEQSQALLNDLHYLKCSIQDAFLLGNSNNCFFLVEFKSINCVNKVLENYCKNFKNQESLPTTTRLLFYSLKQSRSNSNLNLNFQVRDFMGANLKDMDCESSQKHVDFSEQIKEFYEVNKIDDLSYRLRFFIGAILEESIGGIFQNCLCLPFGSSMNKLGAKTADLDLACWLNGNNFLKTIDSDESRLSGRFYFLSNLDEKKQRRKNFNVFELIEIIICNLVPRFKFIQAIPKARVPILKFEAQIGQLLNCDLSLTNVEVSYLMTKLLWSYCKLDERVAPLVFLVRHWACLAGVKLQASPSPSFTSFQLTCLVLFYLLKHQSPVIVWLDDLLDKKQYSNLIRHEKYQDNSVELEEILSNLTMKSDFSDIDLRNNMNLGELFEGFFKFYSTFNFNSNIIALSKTPLNKSSKASNQVFIENPFMPSLNACKNVTPNKLLYFQNMCKTTNTIINKSKPNLNLSKLLIDVKNSKNTGMSLINKDKNVYEDMMIY